MLTLIRQVVPQRVPAVWHAAPGKVLTVNPRSAGAAWDMLDPNESSEVSDLSISLGYES